MNAWAKLFGSQETEKNTTPPESRVVQHERVKEPEMEPQVMGENAFRNLYKQENAAAIKLLLRIGQSYLDSLEETKRSLSQPKAIGYPGHYNPSALLNKDRISHSAPPVNRRYDSLENPENPENVTTVSRPPRPQYRYGSANHGVYEPILSTYRTDRTRKPKRSLSSTNPTNDERNAKRQKITKKTKAARNIFTVPSDDMDLDQSLNEPKSKILQETKEDDEEMAVEPTPVKKLPPAKKPFVSSSKSTTPKFTLQKKTTPTLGDKKNSVPSFLNKSSKPPIMKNITTDKALSSEGKSKNKLNFLQKTIKDDNTKLGLTTAKKPFSFKLDDNGGGKNEKPQSGLKLPFLGTSGGTDKNDDGNKRKRKFSGESNDAMKPIKKPKLGMASLTKPQETKTSTVKPVAKQKSSSQESQKKKPQMSYAMKLIMEKQERIKKEYVKRISNIYKKHNPEKVDGVKNQVEKFMRAKKLHALYEKICKKYKVTAEKEYNEKTSDIYQDDEDDAGGNDNTGKSSNKPKLTSKPIGGLGKTLKLGGSGEKSSFKFTGLGSANKSKEGGLKLGGIGGGGKFTLDKKTTENKSVSEYKLGGLSNSAVDFTQGTTPKTEKKEKDKKSLGSSNPFASIAGGSGNSQPKLNFELPKSGGLNLSKKSESKPFSLTSNKSGGGLKLPNFAKNNNSGGGISFSLNTTSSKNNTSSNNNSLTINTNLNNKPPLGGGSSASPFNIPKFTSNMGGGNSTNNNPFSSGGGSSPFAQLNPSSGNNLTPAPNSNGQFSAGAYKPKRRRRN